jgi:hypothetical protein
MSLGGTDHRGVPKHFLCVPRHCTSRGLSRLTPRGLPKAPDSAELLWQLNLL